VLGSPDGRIHHPPGVFGWKVSDYPGKFIVHAPQVRGDYPTREGLGRELAYWMVLKHIAARSAPQYLERFGSPPVDITYVTGKEGQPGRPASREDIDDAKAAASAEAVRKWAHPDTIKWELKAPDGAGGRAKVTFPEWIDICDSQMSKAVLGGTLTTDVGSSGSRALGGTQRKDQMTVIAHSANTLADSLDEGLVRTWGELNAPDRPDLWPHIELSVEDKADPADIMERAVRAASVGLPVDADKLGEMVALPLVAVDDEKARVIRPVSPTPPTEAPHAPMTGTNNPEASAQRAKEAQAQMASQGLGPDGKPLTTEPDEGDDDTENDEGDEPTTDDDEES
jgi:phage gp29-like protein